MQTILVVDDEPLIRWAIREVLEDAGYAVVEARRLAEARPHVHAGHFDLAILDLNLEDGRGSDLIPELREHAPKTRLLVLSGEASKTLDADLVLLKSIDPHELLRQIEDLLRVPRASS